MERKRAIKQFNELKKDVKNMRLAAEAWDKEWKTLISTILSARTRDETTIIVSEKLFKKYKNVKQLSKARLKDVENIIRPVNFYKNKSKNIIICCKMLDEIYKGKVPHDFNKLIELRGVGRKTANVFLSEQGKQRIAIDTHVGYISKYLGWTKYSEQKKVEADLENLFPENLYKEINPTLVRFGKTHTSRKKKNKLLDEIKRFN